MNDFDKSNIFVFKTIASTENNYVSTINLKTICFINEYSYCIELMYKNIIILTLSIIFILTIRSTFTFSIQCINLLDDKQRALLITSIMFYCIKNC